MITDINGLEYGGKYHRYFWDKSVNPLATVESGLADCTCFVLGDCAYDKLPQPVSPVKNANLWHTCTTNGWYVVPFSEDNVEVGDIVEWAEGCHVARVTKIVDGTIFISGSFYTGIHGRAMWNGQFDTRDGINSLQELSDFMITNYPTRFFHYWSLENENRWVGYSPTYILKQPSSVNPVPQNTKVDQIEVLTNEQNIRNNDDQIVGVAKAGFYNVLRIAHSSYNNYDWYEVEPNRFIAGVQGRVIYHPGTDPESEEVKKLKARIAELEGILKEINKLSEV